MVFIFKPKKKKKHPLAKGKPLQRNLEQKEPTENLNRSKIYDLYSLKWFKWRNLLLPDLQHSHQAGRSVHLPTLLGAMSIHSCLLLAPHTYNIWLRLNTLHKQHLLCSVSVLSCCAHVRRGELASNRTEQPTFVDFGLDFSFSFALQLRTGKR